MLEETNMADDNPDSAVLDLLAAIEERNAKLALATDLAGRQSALIETLVADNETLREEAKHFNELASEAKRGLAEYERTQTKFYRPAQPVQRQSAAEWEPINSWVN